MKRNHKKTGALRWQWRRAHCLVADSSELFKFLLTLSCLSTCACSYHSPSNSLALANIQDEGLINHQTISQSDHQVQERAHTVRAISQQDGADHLSFEPNSSILSSTNMNSKHNLPMHQAPKGYRRLANLSNRTSALRTSSGTLPHSLLLPLSLATQSTTTSTAIPMTQHQQQQQAIRHHEQQVSNQSQKAGLLEKICMGTSNKLSSQHNKSDHYQNLYERYKDCTYVIGNLEITWLDRTSGGNHQEELDLSFLESIREITGYLLIAHVNVTRIRLPNLLIIRGRDLFKSYALNEKEEFALILIENELESLELPNLAEIQAGSMGSYDNRNLCRIRTIDWEDILAKTYKSIFVYNGAQPECPPCDPACMGHCWGEGPEMCQKLSKSTCAHACGGRCFGATSSDCCHQFCAAGCTGPSQTDCLACKNFYDNGSCVQECTSLERYNPSKFEWEPNPDGKYTFGATCTKECPQNMLRDNGACVRVCPPNKRSKNGECVVCAGPCPKKCQGVEVVHSGNIDQLINCTVIDGSITILDESFTGGYFGQLETGPLSQVGPQSQAQPPKQQQQQQLQQQQQQQQSSGLVINQNSSGTVGPSLWHKPMHPSRLEVFKTLREITDYLIIKAKHPDFKDLSYFTNLRAINGGRTTDMLQALSITRTSLVSLNLRSLFHIPKGKITIEDNPELCFADTIDWKQLNISRPEDVTIRNNAESSKCRAATLQCHEQCARDGCWGPGPDECLSCNNYKLDEYCVVNCSSTESLGFLSYEESVGARICKRCHPECSQGCHGTEARHCEACRSVKDGPYCVPECPSHKYNSNGTCLECDKGCGPDGCSGPSSKLGEGGCNSCAKAIIRSHHHDPALAPLDRVSSDGLSFDIECIRAEEPCPDGYYQEYVVGASQPEGSPLKSSSGRPVCRKCHHRCKRCIGMGTHKTVCECAKYVAGEQCEDHCPRDYYADENSRQCVKCSPECNGCFGPTEADCISCRVYRIYYDTGPPTSSNQLHNNQQIGGPMLLADLAANGGGGGGGGGQQRLRFNCTAQCPSDKPHRISERNMLDPYCSDDPGIDIDSPSVTAFSSTTILFMFIISSALMVCISIHRCQIERDKTYKMTMRLSGMDEEEELTPSNEKPNLATLRSIQESELSEGKVLGSGFGGTVHQGFWRRPELNGSIPVAIKKLHDNGQSNIHKEFLEEAYIMASVRHPNLVSLLGVCMTPKDLMLVTPLMPLGCLLDYVKTKENQASITSKMMFEYGNQIAKGMKYLEQRRMVHRDLALRNVLLQTRSRALISDFGLAKFLEIDQSEYHSGGGRLPIKWLAPECIRERKFTHKSDVWAFGVTIWELVTYGQRPFEEYETRDVPLAIEKGARLQQPNHVSAELYKVMYACWFYTPEDRPSFEQLVESFTTFARDPGRYLICGPKVIELCKGLSVLRHLDDDEVNDDRCNDQYDMDDDGDCDESPSEEASPTSLASSQPPLGAAMPNLTPSTHNRLNEMFGFELQRHRASESSDINGPSSSLTTPILKKIGMFSSGSRQLSQSGNHHQHAHHHHHHHQHPHLSSSNLKGSLITTDANNNTFVTNTNNGNANNGCWSMHHTVSSNSLGQRSEQPTDMYDYLLPSPSTNEHGHTFSTFYTNSYDNSDSLSVRNPPHSAGVVSNITNEEYFLTRENYVNDSLQGRSLSTSNGNIPQSLV